MKKQNLEELEKKVENKGFAREKRRRKTMKVSGAGVKGLARIISRKHL